MRLERSIFAGTSSHRDVVVLIDCERELLRRERDRLRSTLRRQGLTTWGDEDEIILFRPSRAET